MSNRKYIRRNKVRKSKTQVRKYKGNPNHKLKSNQYYVKYKTRLSDNAINDEKIKNNVISIKHATKRTDLIPSAANVVIVEGGNINQIRRNPNVVLVEEVPNITYHDEINDPFYNNNFTRDQLYLENIGHRDAIEEFGFGSYSPLLGMMDGAVLSENLPFSDKPPHPDLQGKVTYYQDTNDITFLSENNIGHGTAVASIITTNTNNEFGMGGTCPNCSIVYFDSMYSGNGLFPLLEGGLELGVRAANISMGGTQQYWNPGSEIIQDAINDAYNQGLILVVSAGNDGIDIANEFYTYCSYDNTLCVTTRNQYNTDSSGNFIDVSAPLGECAACPYSNCAYGMDEFGNSANPAWFRGFNGTSSSAPVVTGLVGLLLSHNPDLTSQDIYDIITSTNINSSVGNRPGTIDFYEALSYMYENYVTCILGDLNGDGILDISDIIIMIDMVLGNQPFDVQCGDMNGDGILDISDIILLIQTVLLDNNRMQSTPDLYNMSLNDIKNWVNDNRDVLSLKT
jgi:subtilisin family serine protease